MADLEKILRASIQQEGPMNIETFMGRVVSYYYSTRDPFGTEGDFVTAPEISQMFGELMGAWLADAWGKLGRPDPFLLMECGPGRGALMVDALRATTNVPGFHEAAQIILIETSKPLKEKQMSALSGIDVQWVESLDDPVVTTSDLPVLFIANELLDALPIRQIEMTEQGWKERFVTLDGEEFVFTLAPIDGEAASGFPDAKAGDVFEVSPVRDNFVQELSGLIKERGGAALFIDYGYDKMQAGETLQAVKGHEFVSVLSHIGEADLTSHVNFDSLYKKAVESGIFASAVVEQGVFLERLGIDYRAQSLKKNATPEQAEAIETAQTRLCGIEEMGQLFKVMALCHDEQINFAGF